MTMYTTNSYKFTSYCQLVTLGTGSGIRFGYKYGMIWHGSNLCFPCITVCWSMLPHHQLDVWISWVARVAAADITSGTSRWVLHTLQQLAHVAWRWLGLGLGLGIEDEMQFLDVPQVEDMFSCHKDNITSWDIMYVHVLMLDDWCNPWWWNERFCKLFIALPMMSLPGQRASFQDCEGISLLISVDDVGLPNEVSTCHGRIASVLIQPDPGFHGTHTYFFGGKNANDLYE